MRPVNPINLSERPTFLHGDKVRDKRDVTGRLWRITSRVAYFDTELMSLRAVYDSTDVHQGLLAKDLIPYLEMVVPAAYS